MLMSMPAQTRSASNARVSTVWTTSPFMFFTSSQHLPLCLVSGVGMSFSLRHVVHELFSFLLGLERIEEALILGHGPLVIARHAQRFDGIVHAVDFVLAYDP